MGDSIEDYIRKRLEPTYLDKENKEGVYVCPECLSSFGIEILKNVPDEFMEMRECSSCGKNTKKGLTVSKIVQRASIEDGLRKHFNLADNESLDQTMTLEDIVRLMIQPCSANVIRAIVICLTQPGANDFFLPEKRYIKTEKNYDYESAEKHWREIADKLTYRQRFFNKDVYEDFSWLIEEACRFKSPDKQDQPLLATTLDSGTLFYRARIAQNEKEAQSFMQNPKIELGAPPRRCAANNRMSPAGISILYVAKDAKTCVAEVRPVAGNIVVVGRFKSKKPLVFFDFTVLDQYKPEPPHKLDITYDERTKFQWLLRFLYKEISRLAQIGDIDYVVTQALAEFIGCHDKLDFDGIAFQSAQKEGGVNFVVFDKRSLKESINLCEASEFHMDIAYSYSIRI